MVDKSYLEGHARPASAMKTYFDQTMMPVAIDMAGGMEAGVERVAILVRSRPAIALGTAVLLGAGLARLLLLGIRPRRRFRL